MKIGKFVNTNSKGQFVIPQEYRDVLGIVPGVMLNIIPKYNGLFLEPISTVIPMVSTDDIYLDILLASKGSWGDVSLIDIKKEAYELEESARRKQEW